MGDDLGSNGCGKHELHNGAALYAEGKAMRHCVYTYLDKCRSRESSLWSLRLKTCEGDKRIATIEVNLRSRSIIQVRAQWNRKPGLQSSYVIHQWARSVGLHYAL